jgi:hypothetical protein
MPTVLDHSVRSFFVIARNSSFTYKGRAVNVRDIGSELGVAYVLEGSVQTAGHRVRLIVQLIETQGGAHVWTGRHDGTIDDIFDLQDRITEQVAGALQPSIRFAEIEVRAASGRKIWVPTTMPCAQCRMYGHSRRKRAPRRRIARQGAVCRQNISDIGFDIVRECLAHLV